METEIVFCERCGVSIPEHEIAPSRRAAGGRDLCPSCIAPGAAGDGDLRLYFCENCRVSIAVTDVLTGQARPEGTGYTCAVCSQGSPAERVARRTALEREMASAGPAPSPGGAAVPLYFCDGCNASIPATAVATGRAAVEGGRTWCEGCRPRRSHESGGPGLLPVAAAALLAAGLTAAAFVVLERRAKEDAIRTAAASEDPLAAVRRDVRAAREDAAMARGEVADRADRLDREMERRVEALRADLKAAREAADRSVATQAAASAERLGRMEQRLGELEEEIASGLQAVAERIDRTARTPETAPPPASADPMAPPESPPPADGEGPAPPRAPEGISAEAARTVALLKDKAAEARFAAAIELGKLGEKGVWPHLAEALRGDDDPFVRRACCRSLGELKAFEAFPALVEALSDGEEYVAKQASMVIREMAGQDFGYKQNQAKGDRKKVADRARKWWEENKDRLLPGGG